MSWPQASYTVRLEGNGRSALRAAGVSAGGERTTVVDDPRSGLQVPSRLPTQFELMVSAPRAVYTVDTTERSVSWTVELPSADRPYAFSATVYATWRVADPVEAVRSRLQDPGTVCAAHLDPLLRDAAAQFRIGDSTQLNAHLDRLGLARPLACGVTLVRCGVRVQLDAATRRHLEELENRRRAREIRAEDHLGTVQDGTLRYKETEIQQLLDQQRIAFEHKLREQEDELNRRIENERMRFYAEALEGGNLNLIALRLASNREEIKEVVALLMQQRQLSFDQAHGMVNALLENGLLNRSDARDLTARTAQVIVDHLGGSAFGLPAPQSGVPDTPALPAQVAASIPPPPELTDAVTGAGTHEDTARAERRRRDRERDAAEDGTER